MREECLTGLPQILSEDWTKTLHLQSDRAISVHNQKAEYFRVRIPKVGRALAYHFPSCDAVVGGEGGHVYRLNLEQGRFLAPYALHGNSPMTANGSLPSLPTSNAVDIVVGVNAIDINPAHSLLGFGTETLSGKGTVELWDPRMRQRAGLLTLPYGRLAAMSASSAADYLPGLDEDDDAARRRGAAVAVTALSSHSDGLNMAVGTSTGHTLLYDLRSPRPYALKDQGYGMPIKRLLWPSSVLAMEREEPLVASADAKVVKIWSANTGTANLVSINPPASINDLHICHATGLLFLANEAPAITAYYVPLLGPAPKWCRFLENMVDDGDEEAVQNLYRDYKFIDRKELQECVDLSCAFSLQSIAADRVKTCSLGLDHLIGTANLRPYMHGFFVDLRLYTKARAVANPFAYAEYRERLVTERLEKERESRIRSKDGTKPKSANVNATVTVNRDLVSRLRAREDKDERRRARKVPNGAGDVPSGDKEEEAPKSDGRVTSLLEDTRFKAMFTDTDFEIDTTTREFALLNPSATAVGQAKVICLYHFALIR